MPGQSARANAKHGHFFVFVHGRLPSVARKQRLIGALGSASHAFLRGAGNARVVFDRYFQNLGEIIRMRVFRGALVLALLAGAGTAYAQEKPIPKYGEQPNDKTPQEKAAEK